MSPASESPFSPRTVAAMVGVAVVAFCGFITLLAYAPALRSGNDGGAHALSRSAVGFAGLVKLLDAHGHDVLVGRTAEPVDGPALQIIAPDVGDDVDSIGKATIDQAPLLIILPKWFTTPDQRRSGWVRRSEPIPDGVLASLVDGLSSKAKLARAEGRAPLTLTGAGGPFDAEDVFSVGEIDGLQTADGPNLLPLLTDPDGRVVLGRVRDKNVFILADPDLVSNHGLKSYDRALLADLMIYSLSNESDDDGERSTIVFDATLNGFGEGRSLLRLALAPPFLAATLCVLAAALMAGLNAMMRFGPALIAERAVALGKRALADNAAALIRLAKREHAMAPRYAQLVREQTARAVGVPRDLGAEAQTAYLDGVAERRGAAANLTDLTAAAAAARTPAALLDAARALFRWRTEMTRAR